MKSGVLKNILVDNHIKYIKIHFKHIKPFTVVNIRFDKNSRKAIFLEAAPLPLLRNNRIHSLKSFLLDFKDTHELLVVRKDTNNIYKIDSSFDVDKSNETLNLYIE